MTPEQQKIIQALLAGGMPAGDMSGASPFRQRAMAEAARMAQYQRADAFERAAPPGQQYSGAGLGGMTAEPFDPREEMSAPAQPTVGQVPSERRYFNPYGMEGEWGETWESTPPEVWSDGLYNTPAVDAKSVGRPVKGQHNAIQAALADMPPQAQQAIMQAVQQGMSPDDAIAQVLGIDMNAISRGQ